ncbi:hypothetical protein DWB77_00893 [Streptomyces hundungensis]|uniref:DUF4253 domain-containing protein n=1 Tax=Streptomyces hundungensis TaxID=1077946 RepID=A0A387H4W0_9ACTN|nr:DUF4253 domain-containing protein [Streptomyces hundungensis]AYG78785.1 hypothetical protein DWB77_00893 [Streptomyces hundungensis]
MVDPTPLPPTLHPLFPDGAAEQSSLATPLPPGRLITPAGSEGNAPVMWLSDGPTPTGLWEKLHREHARSGLWPLLLTHPANDPDFRPWATGELAPGQSSAPDFHDPEAVLRGWWNALVDGSPDHPQDAAERLQMLEPYGPDWPGLAPTPRPAAGDAPADAADAADAVAGWLLDHDPKLRIGLVRADSGAEALAACGWTGAARHADTGAIAAVLRGWEQRYGARLVEVGPGGLRLSVTARPDGLEEALPVAAEHVAFCPDNVFRGTESLTDYAEELVEEKCWSFWWH